MTLHGTPNDGHPLPGDECRECGQRVPVRLRDLLRLDRVVRGVPGTLWVRFIVRPRLEPPSRVLLVQGLVTRYAAGPLVVLVLPAGPPAARYRAAS